MKFIDPRIDFAFRKIFGSEETKGVLKSFVEAVLGLEGDKRLKKVQILNPYQLPKLKQLKVSILDVKCTDHRGVTYLVEMQIKKTKDFLKRVQYNLCKAYSGQIKNAEDYPKLNQVIGITITNFTLFPFKHFLSCHTTRETLSNELYLDEILYYFIELSKFNKKLNELISDLDKWIYFIKYAGELDEVPGTFKKKPFKNAFETAMISNMTQEEFELYDSAAMQIADTRGAIELAHEEGFKEGIEKGREEGVFSGRQEVVLKQLKKKFKEIPLVLEEKIKNIKSLEKLDEILLAVLDVNSVDEIEKMI